MSWKKVKLGDILTESKIISEKPNPDRRITVRLKVLGVEKRGLENEVEGATKQYIRKAGQFIYGKQNFHKGAFGIIPPELDGFESSSDLPAFDVDKSCLPEFIFYFFKQGNFYLELSKIASGVATQRINTTQLFELELMLPDIKTQKLLISNIQLLEKNGLAITNELTHQLTLVKKLRQSFLQEAVQGKLVEQNPADEPASELLKKIKAEKEKLIAEKKLKKEKPLPPIQAEEIPFEIPEGWVWCRLGEIIKISSGDGLTASQMDKNGTIPVYGGNGINGYHNKFNLEKETIVIGRVGYYCGCIHLTKKQAWITDNAFVVTFPENQIWRDFLIKLLKWADLGKQQFAGSQPVISGQRVYPKLIPLPPLSEQIRIVQKLDELMQTCDELEASIKESQAQNEKLLQQVLREALRK